MFKFTPQQAQIDIELFAAFLSKVEVVLNFLSTNEGMVGLEEMLPGGIEIALAIKGLDVAVGIIVGGSSVIAILLGAYEQLKADLKTRHIVDPSVPPPVHA